MAFPQKLQFVFKHFITVILTSVANAFYAQMIHMINCNEVFTKSSAFQESILIFRSDISGTAETFLFSGRCILIALRAKKPYLVIQTWRIVRWFWYLCYDIGCYPWDRSLDFDLGFMDMFILLWCISFSRNSSMSPHQLLTVYFISIKKGNLKCSVKLIA